MYKSTDLGWLITHEGACREMRQTLQTRWLLWKKQWLSVLFWFIFPLAITIYVMMQFAIIQEDTQIPIGVVLEDTSDMADKLVHSLEQTPHIRPIVLSEREAKQQLEKHELDSLFIVHRNYEQNIQKGNRNKLVTTYQSDMSFAYAPVRETFISFVQQDYTRAKTVQTIEQMLENYGINTELSSSDIIARSQAIESEQQLISTDFLFANSENQKTTEQKSWLDPWGLWALVSMLATFMLFDWVIKEKRAQAIKRLAFSQLTLKKYLWNNFLIYTGLLVMIDFLTAIIFATVFHEQLTAILLISLIIYRLTLTIIIFLVSQLFRSTFMYYATSFTMTLLAVIFSGIFIPINGQLLNYFHPVAAFQAEISFNGWLIVGIVWLLVWLFRKEEHYA